MKNAAGFGKCAPAESTTLEMLVKTRLALTLPCLDVERGKEAYGAALTILYRCK